MELCVIIYIVYVYIYHPSHQQPEKGKLHDYVNRCNVAIAIKAQLQSEGVYSPPGCVSSTQLKWSRKQCHWTLVNTYYIRPLSLPSLEGIAALPNTQKWTQGGYRTEETKKHLSNERTEKIPEKELNKMETSNLLDAEFKTLVIRMLNELSEDLNSIKKDQ